MTAFHLFELMVTRAIMPRLSGRCWHSSSREHGHGAGGAVDADVIACMQQPRTRVVHHTRDAEFAGHDRAVAERAADVDHNSACHEEVAGPAGVGGVAHQYVPRREVGWVARVGEHVRDPLHNTRAHPDRGGRRSSSGVFGEASVDRSGRERLGHARPHERELDATVGIALGTTFGNDAAQIVRWRVELGD